MTETNFTQRRIGEGADPLACREAGAGDAIVAIVGGGGLPTRAHALLAGGGRVIVFSATGSAEATARRIAGALATLGVDRCDLIGEGAGAAAAVRLALVGTAEIGAVVLAAPDDGLDDNADAFRGMTRPVLVLVGTKDQRDAGDRCRRLLPACHLMFVYDTGAAIGDERPEAFAFIVREFVERRDLFLVSRESGVAFP